MPVACANCGNQNADGNNFCQNCGRPLTAAAPAAAAAPPPPPPAPAPPPPPPTYQSPYYQPAQPMPVSRTPVGLIVGVVVGLLVLMGRCGVVAAAVVAHPKPSPVAHVSAVPSSAPTTAPTAIPTSAPTAAPTNRPTPRPTQAPPTGGCLVTKTWTANAPGFKVLKQDDYSADLETPDGDGTLFIQSGSLQQQTNTSGYVASVLSSIAKKYPDASVCLKPNSETHGGLQGIIVGACYTYAPQNAQAFKAADVFWISVSSSNVLYVYEVFTQAQNFDHVYNQECLPVIQSLAWRD